jgi:cytoskeletal protein RodZ
MIPVALILLAVGLLCLLYALASLCEAPPDARAVVSGRAGVTESDTAETAAEETAETAIRSDTSATAVSATTAESAALAGSPGTTDPPTSAAPAVSDETPATTEPAARPAATPARRNNQLATPQGKSEMLWVMTVLPLLFAFLILGLILIRRLRPRPLKRSGPSDMTDAWQEAGRRMK